MNCRLCVPNIMSLGVCFIKTTVLVTGGAFAASKFALFSVSDLKDKKLIKKQKSKPTQKLKHANSILESFQYFCQISSKSMVIILSYTVSKLARFFETQCTCKLSPQSLLQTT